MPLQLHVVITTRIRTFFLIMLVREETEDMYVCNCNGISERMVQTALKHGATTWTEVHQYFDFAPCCGKCSSEINSAITLQRQQATTGSLPQPILKPALLASDC